MTSDMKSKDSFIDNNYYDQNDTTNTASISERRKQRQQNIAVAPFCCLPFYYMFCCFLCPKNNKYDNSQYLYDQNVVEPQSITWKRIQKQFSIMIQLSYPYFKESTASRWFFIVVCLLGGCRSGINVLLSYVTRDFWNALSDKNYDSFYVAFGKYMFLLVLYAPVYTFYDYAQNMFKVHWREWMTNRTYQLYSSNQVYFKLDRLQILKEKIHSSDSTDKVTSTNADGTTTTTFPSTTSTSTNNKKSVGMMSETIDNPDERMTEDIKTFTETAIELVLDVLTTVIDLGSFSVILYTIYPKLLITCIVYATIGTIFTYYIGKSLVNYNFQQLRKEADLRYLLVRMRDNAESIAFYNGEEIEGYEIEKRIYRVMYNKRILYAIERNLSFFTTSYIFLIQIVPVAVIAPQYFAGAVQLGIINQSVSAFNHVLGDLSIIIEDFVELSHFSAVLERLSDFYEAIRTVDNTRSERTPLLQLGNSTNCRRFDDDTSTGELDSITSITIDEDGALAGNKFKMVNLQTWQPLMYSNPPTTAIDSNGSVTILQVNNLDLCTPDRKRILFTGLTFNITVGNNLLIVGPSGVGKSSLLRAIAGLWDIGNGSIKRPADDDVYFLPQRPYCTVGTLKDQLLYPSIEYDDNSTTGKSDNVYTVRNHRILKEMWSDDDLVHILEQVNLYDVAVRSSMDGNPINGLYSIQDWSNQLSLGEQQRLAFGRLLVNKPSFVILDEATSALDVDNENKMYSLLNSQSIQSQEISELDDYGKRKSTLGLTYISIGHRPTISQYHQNQLHILDSNHYEITSINN